MSVWHSIGAVLLLGAACGPAHAQWTGSVTAASDYVSRGVSQTQRTPALQLDGEYAGEAGWYLGGFASNVDYTPAGSADDGIGVEYAARAGWRHALSDDASLEFGIEHMRYPGARGFDADYTEYGIALTLGAVTAGVVHAPDYYGLGGAATDATLATSIERGAWTFDAMAGYYEQRDLVDDGYPYLDVAATRTIGPVSVQLGWGGATRWSPALAEVNGRRELSKMSARVAVWVAF